jgi:hypothetical protein
MDLIFVTVDTGQICIRVRQISPNTHALFNISRRHLFVQVDYEFGELFYVDYVARVLSFSFDNFRASGDRKISCFMRVCESKTCILVTVVLAASSFCRRPDPTERAAPDQCPIP